MPTPPGNSASRFIGLDGLRALAVAAVIVYHFWPRILPGGFLGVDVFFVISGFLITHLLITSAQKGSFSLREFWRRRARRILPALLAMVFLCCLAAAILGGDLKHGLRTQVAGALTFSSNWAAIRSSSNYFDQTSLPLFRNLWSLAMEEQFYVVWLTMAALLGPTRAI